MRGVALTLRQPSCVASDKVCGFQRQRNLYMDLFLRQSLRVLRTEGRRPKELKSILRETSFISNRMHINSLTQTAQNTLNLYQCHNYHNRTGLIRRSAPVSQRCHAG